MRLLMVSVLMAMISGPLLAEETRQFTALKMAIEVQKNCQNSVRYDSKNIYLGFDSPRGIRVIPRDKPSEAIELMTSDSAIDSVTIGSQLFVLTHSAIEEWDLLSKKRVSTFFEQSSSLSKRERPVAIAQYKNKIIVAHGLQGVSFLDLATKKVATLGLIQNRLPLRSFATAVTILGKKAYVTLDSEWPVGWFQIPFKGIVVIDMETEKVVAELEGLNPGADSIAAEGDRLIVGYGGAVYWKYRVSDFRQKKLPNPVARLWQFPSLGHPVGRGTLDAENYYTCFADPSGRMTPQALDRQFWGLN